MLVATPKPPDSSVTEGKPKWKYIMGLTIAVKILYICMFHKTNNYVNSLLSPLPGSCKVLFQGGTPRLKLY